MHLGVRVKARAHTGTRKQKCVCNKSTKALLLPLAGSCQVADRQTEVERMSVVGFRTWNCTLVSLCVSMDTAIEQMGANILPPVFFSFFFFWWSVFCVGQGPSCHHQTAALALTDLPVQVSWIQILEPRPLIMSVCVLVHATYLGPEHSTNNLSRFRLVLTIWKGCVRIVRVQVRIYHLVDMVIMRVRAWGMHYVRRHETSQG